MHRSGSRRSALSEAQRLAGRILESAKRNDVLGATSQIAFHFLFALPPFALFVAALSAFLAAALHVANPADVIIGAVHDNLPPAIADAWRPDIQRLLSAPRIDLLGFGAIVAIVAATNGTNSLIKGIHRAYDVPENRPFVLRYLVALGLTLLAALGVIISFAVIFAGSAVTAKAASDVGFGSGPWTVIQLLRWPVVFLALTGSVAALYRYGPNVVVPWRWILLGSALFAVGWLIATALLGLYAERAGSFGATYGSLGSVIVLMAWFWVTAGLLLLGAEVSAAVARERSPGEIRRRPAQNRAAAKIKGAEQGAAGAATGAAKGAARRTTDGGAS